MIDSRTYNVPETITYSGENGRSTDAQTATNVFDYAAGEVTYLSRADGFANYAEATAAPATYTLPEDQKETFINNSNYDPTAYNNEEDEMPTTPRTAPAITNTVLRTSGNSSIWVAFSSSSAV